MERSIKLFIFGTPYVIMCMYIVLIFEINVFVLKDTLKYMVMKEAGVLRIVALVRSICCMSTTGETINTSKSVPEHRGDT